MTVVRQIIKIYLIRQSHVFINYDTKISEEKVVKSLNYWACDDYLTGKNIC
jgi:hypothetical protein